MVIQTYIKCSDAEIEPETGVFDPEIERVRPVSMGWRLDKPSADYEGMKLVGQEKVMITLEPRKAENRGKLSLQQTMRIRGWRDRDEACEREKLE